jgi:chorismate lyase
VPAVYAASWWSSDTFAEFMSDSASPMWSNLRSANVELYREVRRVYQGDNKALEEVFGTTGPFWGRHYIFWHAGKPMTVVYEVFNPRLENALGPAKPP